MVKVTFKVSVDSVKCTNLTPKDGNSNDPFIQFNFAGSYKIFKTKHIKRELNPVWDSFSIDFFYTTIYAHRLNQKFLIAEVFDYNSVKANILIGSARVDLHTLATGARHQDLQLRDEHNQPTGRVQFSVDMVEVCNDFNLNVSKVTIQNWEPPVAVGQTAQLSLSTSYSEEPDNRSASSYVSANLVRNPNDPNSEVAGPTWNDPIELRVTRSDVNQMLQATLNIAVELNTLKIAECQLPIMSFYQCGQDIPVPFSGKVIAKATNQVVGTLVGLLQVLKGPRFLQLEAHSEAEAVHNDDGVFSAVPPRLGWPVPDKLFVRASAVQQQARTGAGSPVPALTHMLSASSSVPPLAHMTSSNGPPALQHVTSGLPPAVQHVTSMNSQQIAQHGPPLPPRPASPAMPRPGNSSPVVGPVSLSGAVPPQPLPKPQPSTPTPSFAPPPPTVPIIAPVPVPAVPSGRNSPAMTGRTSPAMAVSSAPPMAPTPAAAPTPASVPAPAASAPPAAASHFAVVRTAPQPRVFPPLAPVPRPWTQGDENVALPQNWTIAKDKDGHAYFKFAPTKQTTWQDPRGLPSGWEQKLDKTGRLYFAYKPTKSTSWIDPRGLPDGWEMIMEKDVPQPVFLHEKSERKTLVEPRGVPDGFDMAIDPGSNCVFFKNHAARNTQWNDPRDSLSEAEQLQIRERQRAAWNAKFLEQLQQDAAEEKLRQSAEGGGESQFEKEWEHRMDTLLREKSQWLQRHASERKLEDIKTDVGEVKKCDDELAGFEAVWQQELADLEAQYQRKRKELTDTHAMLRAEVLAQQKATRERSQNTNSEAARYKAEEQQYLANFEQRRKQLEKELEEYANKH